MAPGPVFSRYKAYKAGTTKLVDWLGKTASRCCDLSKIMSRGSSKKTSSTKSKEDTVRVSTRDLIRFAEAIAAADPAIEVPTNIVDLAADVIEGRCACAEWYQQSGTTKDNDSHRHFIEVLRHVRKTLISAIKNHKGNSWKDQGDGDGGVDTQGTLSNLFAHLEVEEPSSEPLGNAPVRSPNVSSERRYAEATFKLDAEDAEQSFAVWCYLEDLNDVCQYICDTWVQYAVGEVSLPVAAMVANVGFGLMRRAHAEFAESYPKLDKQEDFASYLGVESVVTGTRVTTFVKNDRNLGKSSRTTASAAELVCNGASCLLKALWTSIQAGKESSADAFPNQSLLKDPLGRAFTQLFSLPIDRDLSRVPGADEFVTAVCQFLATTDAAIPMWLAVACQTYSTISHILRGNMDCGMDTVLNFCKSVCDTYEIDCKATNENRTTFPKAPDYTRYYQYARSTIIAFARIQWIQAAGIQMNVDIDATRCLDEYLMMHFPVFRGVVLYDLKVNIHAIGIRIANESRVFLSAAHVYKAACNYGYLSKPWHDMDQVLSMHGKKQPLVTKLNPNADCFAMARHYQIALGASITVFKPDTRPPLPSRSILLAKFRKLEFNSEFIRGMIKIAGKFDSISSDESRLYETVLRDLAEREVASSASRQKSDGVKHLTPVQLLGILKKSVVQDEVTVNFNYIGFARFCLRLMMCVNAVVSEQFPLLGPTNDEGPFKLTDNILWETASAVSRSISVINTPMDAAQFVIDDFINRTKDSEKSMEKKVYLVSNEFDIDASVNVDSSCTTGRYFSKVAFNLSSGRIPRDHRPRLDNFAGVEFMEELFTDGPDALAGLPSATVPEVPK